MAIARVQKQVNARNNNVSSDTVTLNGVASGNLLVLYVTHNPHSGSSGTSVANTNGVAWTQAIHNEISHAFDWDEINIFYLVTNVAGTWSAVVTRSGGGNTDWDCWMAEYSGIATTGPLDAAVISDGSYTPSSGVSFGIASGTLAQADELLCAMFVHSASAGSAITTDGTYTQINNPNSPTQKTCNAQDKIVASTASDTADWSIAAVSASNGYWIAGLVSFKADTGGAPSAFPAHYYNAMMEA